MSNQGHIRPGEFRKPICEILPDLRKRITRYFAITTGASLRDGLFVDWGTVDSAPATGPTAGFDGLRLIKQDVQELDGSNVLVHVYETIPATAEIQVGNNTQISLEDGRTAIEAEFLQFSAGSYVPGTVGTTTAPGDASAFMQRAEQTNDGTLRRIKRTYVYAGLIQQSDETKYNGALLIRTLTYVKTTPPTPDGYVLFRTSSNPVNGIPVLTYSFAAGDGEISRDIDYGQSSDQGTTGVTRTTITHLTPSSTASDPTTLSGSVKIGERKADQDGYRIWVITYAKGTGLVVDEVSIRSRNKLRIYHRTALGTAPTAPSAAIGGTVTLFDTSTRQADGYIIYDYRWSETAPDAQVGIDVRAREDGSLVYTVTEIDLASAVPSYPGSGTAYLVDQDQNVNDNFYSNRAVYIKPPATVTLKRPHQFDMPGTAAIETTASGHNLLLTPSKIIPILAEFEVSYDTTQLDTAHYYVAYGSYLLVDFIRDGQALGESQQQAFSNYVSGGGTAAGTTPDKYNGVTCEAYDVRLLASSPTAQPSGATVIEPPTNEIYLMAINGTIVYRRTLISYTF